MSQPAAPPPSAGPAPGAAPPKPLPSRKRARGNAAALPGSASASASASAPPSAGTSAELGPEAGADAQLSPRLALALAPASAPPLTPTYSASSQGQGLGLGLGLGQGQGHGSGQAGLLLPMTPRSLGDGKDRDDAFHGLLWDDFSLDAVGALVPGTSATSHRDASHATSLRDGLARLWRRELLCDVVLRPVASSPRSFSRASSPALSAMSGLAPPAAVTASPRHGAVEGVPVHGCVVSALSAAISETLEQRRFDPAARSVDAKGRDVVDINLDEDVLSALVSYMYHGDLHLRAENGTLILAGAMALQIEGAVTAAMDFLSQTMSESTVMTTLTAALQLTCRELAATAFDFVDANFPRVVVEQGWIDAPRDVVARVLARDELVVHRESEVFRALARWTMENVDARRAAFEAMIVDPRMFRAAVLTNEELGEVGTSPVFTRSDVAARLLREETARRRERRKPDASARGPRRRAAESSQPLAPSTILGVSLAAKNAAAAHHHPHQLHAGFAGAPAGPGAGAPASTLLQSPGLHNPLPVSRGYSGIHAPPSSQQQQHHHHHHQYQQPLPPAPHDAGHAAANGAIPVGGHGAPSASAGSGAASGAAGGGAFPSGHHHHHHHLSGGHGANGALLHPPGPGGAGRKAPSTSAALGGGAGAAAGSGSGAGSAGGAAAKHRASAGGAAGARSGGGGGTPDAVDPEGPRINPAAIRTLTAHTKPVCALATAPEWGAFVSGSADNTMRVWSATTFECVKVLTEHAGSVVALRPCRGLLVSGSFDKSIRVWDPAKEWACTEALSDAHGAPVTALCVVKDGAELASGSAQGEIKIWVTADWTCLKTLANAHEHVVWSLCELGPGALASGSSDSSIKVWSKATWALLRTLAGHRDEVQALAVLPGTNELVSGSDDGMVMVHDLETLQLKHQFVLFNRPVLFAYEDGRNLYLGLGDGGIIVFRVGVWDVVQEELRGHASNVMSLTLLSPHGPLVSASYDATVRVWEFLE